MYKTANTNQRNSLLESSLGALLRAALLNDPDERLKKFIRAKKYDEESFTSFFPEDVIANFSSRQWSKIVIANPQLFKSVPENMVPFLNSEAWVRLLGADPELINQCPCLEDFSSCQWCSILLQSPVLRDFLPDFIQFTQKEQNRLTPKGIF